MAPQHVSHPVFGEYDSSVGSDSRTSSHVPSVSISDSETRRFSHCGPPSLRACSGKETHSQTTILPKAQSSYAIKYGLSYDGLDPVPGTQRGIKATASQQHGQFFLQPVFQSHQAEAPILQITPPTPKSELQTDHLPPLNPSRQYSRAPLKPLRPIRPGTFRNLIDKQS